MIFKKRYKLIACEVLFREICYCASKCSNIIDIEFMEKSLHDIGKEKMSKKLQHELDKTDVEKYEAILLCYGLCNNGICNLHSSLPIVVPRAHDCITLLMGSKEKYKDYFDHNSGTFFYSPGWIERSKNSSNTGENTPNTIGFLKSYEEYVEIYDEETAQYLIETLDDWLKNYRKCTFINTFVGHEDSFREISKQFSIERGWEYEEISGDTGLVYRLLNGDWNPEEFLILPPNGKIVPTYDNSIIRSVEQS